MSCESGQGGDLQLDPCNSVGLFERESGAHSFEKDSGTSPPKESVLGPNDV